MFLPSYEINIHHTLYLNFRFHYCLLWWFAKKVLSFHVIKLILNDAGKNPEPLLFILYLKLQDFHRNGSGSILNRSGLNPEASGIRPEASGFSPEWFRLYSNS